MRWLACAAAAALASALVSCGRQAPPAMPPSVVTVSVPPPQKALLRGLIDMQDISWHNTDNATPTFDMSNVDEFPGLFGGIVLNVAWSQMEPSPTQPLDFTYTDAALAAVQAYNAANPRAQLGVKLRIYGGSNAPQWAKTLTGKAITIYRNPAGCGGDIDTCVLTVGPFWTQDYIDFWRAFQAKVAAKYDANPLIEAVAVTSCASQTDEPFVPTTGPIGKANLKAAGYSDSAEQACLTGAVQDYAAWQNTPLDFTFNTYNKVSGGLDPGFTQSVITLCRERVGAPCVLDNHALAAPVDANATPDPVYSMIQAAGPPINFQTGSPAAMECLWTQTLSQGIAYGARAIEVWPKFSGFTTLTVPQVTQLRALFYATPPPVAPTPDPNASPCPAFN